MSLCSRRSFQLPRMLVLGIPCMMACPGWGGDGGGGAIPGDGTTSVASTLSGPVGGEGEPGLDSTGWPQSSCIDDYEGNHSPASAFALGLDSTDTARGVFGDGVVLGAGNEQGADLLVVCPGSPDFFTLDVACAGYLGVELRPLGDGDVELHLYDGNGLELDRSLATCDGFLVHPVHRFVEPGEHVIEARHGAGGAQAYGLDVYVLPMLPCR